MNETTTPPAAAETNSGDNGQNAVEFNEAAYLVAFPRIAEKVRAGALKSGFDHYMKNGAAEGRLSQPRYQKALAEQALLQRLSSPTKQAPDRLAGEKRADEMPVQRSPIVPAAAGSGVDALLVGDSGYCLAIGWIDDRSAPLTAVGLRLPDDQLVLTQNFGRCRRADAEAVIGSPPGQLLGFYAFFNLDHNEPPGAGTVAILHCGAETAAHAPKPNYMARPLLRDSIFEYLAAARYFGNPAVESFLQLEGGIGGALLDFNRAISRGITRLAHVERHGPLNRRFVASIVVCLYGKPEYLFLQAAMFSAAPGATDYEYVYVSNSPELTEILQREARIAAQLYGLSITMIFLPGNAGFGAANNAAVSHAQSDRVIMLNPDVFPRDRLWAQRHTALVEELPEEQTRLFGAPLFYDDGSLMHGGMFIDTDIGLSIKPDGIVQQQLLRVEHYGKGAPPQTALYKQSRKVTAVTGAFISADRHWFEELGGFSEEYVFGHYEDADLCLKSWREGGEVWIHNLPLWHLEGKGSTRKPAHEGGSTINRWHFTRTWLDTVQNGFGGSAPALKPYLRRP